jgi:hypothetical protein
MMDTVIPVIPAATVADRGDGRRGGRPRRRGGAAVSARSGTSTVVPNLASMVIHFAIALRNH